MDNYGIMGFQVLNMNYSSKNRESSELKQSFHVPEDLFEYDHGRFAKILKTAKREGKWLAGEIEEWEQKRSNTQRIIIHLLMNGIVENRDRMDRLQKISNQFKEFGDTIEDFVNLSFNQQRNLLLAFHSANMTRIEALKRDDMHHIFMIPYPIDFREMMFKYFAISQNIEALNENTKQSKKFGKK